MLSEHTHCPRLVSSNSHLIKLKTSEMEQQGTYVNLSDV